jgi:hypothetical protein
VSIKAKFAAMREALLEWKVFAHFIDVEDAVGFAKVLNAGEDALRDTEEIVARVEKMELVIAALATSDPLYERQIWVDGKQTTVVVCALCDGEIPDGHGADCPWWMSRQLIREVEALSANKSQK